MGGGRRNKFMTRNLESGGITPVKLKHSLQYLDESGSVSLLRKVVILMGLDGLPLFSLMMINKDAN